MNQKLVGRWTLVVSVGLHVYAFFATPEFTQAKSDVAPEPNVIKFTVTAPEPKPEPEAKLAPEPEAKLAPEPEVEPKPEPEVVPPQDIPELVVEPEAAPPASQAEPAPELQAEPEPAPAELTGTTLAALDGLGWDAPAGSGRERRGALRPGVSRPVAPTKQKPQAVKPPAAPPPPPILPLAQLSKHPVPPSLGGALKRNYPRAAQRQGQSGEAKVRARIEANGHVTLAKVAFESAEGFGSACRKTLLASKWSAPLDKKGRPVATWVSYRCKFRIDE